MIMNKIKISHRIFSIYCVIVSTFLIILIYGFSSNDIKERKHPTTMIHNGVSVSLQLMPTSGTFYTIFKGTTDTKDNYSRIIYKQLDNTLYVNYNDAIVQVKHSDSPIGEFKIFEVKFDTNKTWISEIL